MGFFKNVLGGIGALALSFSLVNAEVTVLTEEFPPFNYSENGQITGLSTEVVQKIMEKVGENPANIEIFPWSRAYTITQLQANKALYSTTRTQQREALFKWVGPISTYKLVMYGKKGSGVKLEKLEDAKKLKAVGVALKDASHQMLETEGFTNIDPDAKNNNPKKLMAGNIDVWLVADVVGIYKAIQAGVNPDEVEKVLDVKENTLYIAFNKDTPDETVAKWQKAFDELKTSGELDKIKAKYLK